MSFRHPPHSLPSLTLGPPLPVTIEDREFLHRAAASFTVEGPAAARASQQVGVPKDPAAQPEHGVEGGTARAAGRSERRLAAEAVLRAVLGDASQTLQLKA